MERDDDRVNVDRVRFRERELARLLCDPFLTFDEAVAEVDIVRRGDHVSIGVKVTSTSRILKTNS